MRKNVPEASEMSIKGGKIEVDLSLDLGDGITLLRAFSAQGRDGLLCSKDTTARQEHARPMFNSRKNSHKRKKRLAG